MDVSQDCTNNYIELYDGSSLDSPVLATICAGLNIQFTSSSNNMIITFAADSHSIGRGFSAEYKTVE